MAYSVLQIVAALEKASSRDIPYKICEWRAGDIATSVARADKARNILGWTSSNTLDDICQSSWNWQFKNPMGYKTNRQ
jgi:UDP-glucose 4-epimerase